MLLLNSKLVTICLLSLSYANSHPQKGLHQEVAPHVFDGKRLKVMVLSPEGFKPNSLVKLSYTKLDGSIVTLDHPIKINAEGEVVNTQLHPDTFFKGEPIIYTVETLDNKQKASVKIVPFPIEAKDDQGHRISLEHISLEGISFNFKAEGFEPFETLSIRSKSGHEKLEFRTQVKEDGTLQNWISPAIIGQHSGTASLEVAWKKTDRLHLDYAWGELCKKSP